MARTTVKIRYRRDRGVWEVDYRDRSGQRHRPLFASEQEAHEHATEILRTSDQEIPETADRDVTIRAYAERWLADVALERDKNTVRGYRQNLERHVLPALGHHRLRSLHRQHIKAFLLDKRREGYAKNSVRLMKAPLSVLLSDAVDEGIIPVNPALQLGRGKATRADKLNAAERLQRVRPMGWEQRDAFLEAAATERPYPSTTLRYYARWIPSKGRRWADLLDRVTDFLGSKLGTKKWNQNETGAPDVSEAPVLLGGPSRTRTVDPLIKRDDRARTERYHDELSPREPE